MSLWVIFEIKYEVKTYLDLAFHFHLVVVLSVHKTLYGTEGCLYVFSLNRLHQNNSVWEKKRNMNVTDMQ